MKPRRTVPKSVPFGVLHTHIRRTRATFVMVTAGVAVAGLVAVVIALLPYSRNSPVPIAAGIIAALVLLAALVSGLRAYRLREGSPLLRLLADPKRIVWHFVHVTITRTYGFVTGEQHDVVVADEDGETSWFYVPAEAVESVRKALSGLAPHATSGFSEANAKAYQEEPLHLRQHDPRVDPDDHEGDAGEAGDDGSPYRGAPRRANPANEDAARAARRAAIRARRRRNVALVLGTPVVVVATWVGVAQREVAARDRRELDRHGFAKGPAGVAAFEREARAMEGVDEPPPIASACRLRLVHESWVHVAMPELAADGSLTTGFYEAYWGDHSTTFAGVSMNPSHTTTMDVLGTPPWEWVIATREKPTLLITTKVLRERPEGPTLVVRMVERDGGRLVCQGTIEVPTAYPQARCYARTLKESEKPRCEAAFRKNATIVNGLQQAIRAMRGPGAL